MLSNVKKQAFTLVTENAAAILTAGGVVGTVATAVLSGKASITAYKLLELEQEELESRAGDENMVINPTIPLQKKVAIVWPIFIAPVAMGVATIAAIVMANRMSAQRAAALAAAYGISSKQLEEYKAKMEQKLTGKKAEEIRDEIQQDRIDRNPPRDNVIIVGTGPVLCYDSFSDRYFKSTAEHLRQAAVKVNNEIDTGNECRLGVFYRHLDLPETMFDDMLGWNVQSPCKIAISPMLMNDDACLCVEFVNLPMPNFGVDY